MGESRITLKPVVTTEDIHTILSDIYGLNCEKVEDLNGYDDNNYHVFVESAHRNRYLDNISADGYVLKIINSLDSEKLEFFDAQNAVLQHLGQKGFVCPKSVKNVHGGYLFKKQLSSGVHIVRLLEYISGTILRQVDCSSDVFYQCGKYIAELDEALKDFHHPVYDDHITVWQLHSTPQLSQFTSVVKDASQRRIVEEVIEQFQNKVLPVAGELDKGIIHGDFNEYNILLCEQNDKWRIKGILDFGDSHKGCYLYELAITLAYMIIQAKDINICNYVLAGYTSIRKIPKIEMDLLQICVCSRICQSLVLGAYTSLSNHNHSYILSSSKNGWKLLQELWSIPNDELHGKWSQVNL